LSWNALGKDPETGTVIGRAFEENTDLKHVDLSQNSIPPAQITLIAEGLDQNHTILGIHMLGNECEVDAKGFLQLPTRPQSVLKSHIYTRSQSCDVVYHRNFSNCWICDKMIEATFYWE
jgi:hypothetical protein